jgi:hypothetical protein
MWKSRRLTNLWASTACYRVRDRVTLRLAIYRQSAHLGDKPLETHGQYFLQLNTCGHSPYESSSLTRGWVCRLQLLLALASAVILRSESGGNHDHILLSQIRDPQPESQAPVFISSQEQGGPVIHQALRSPYIASYDSHREIIYQTVT